MIPFGAFAPDVADYNLEVAAVADNCVAIPNGFRGLPAPENATDVEPSGITSLAAGSISAIRIYNQTDAAWYTVLMFLDSGAVEFWATDGFNSEFTGDTTVVTGAEPWATKTRFTPILWDGDLIIFGNVGTPQIITDANFSQSLSDNGTTKTSDLGGSPPSARFATRAGVHLFLGYTRESGVDYPSRVWWSGYDDYTGWTAGDNQAGFFDLPTGGEITGVSGGEGAIIFQQNRITRAEYIGVPAVWSFSPVHESTGCHAPNSIVKVGADVYFLSPTGFCVIRGGQALEFIGGGVVDQWLKETAGDDASYATWASWVSGAYDEVSGCIFWAFTDKDSTNSDGLNNRMVIFNTRMPVNRAWSTATDDSYFLFALEPQGEGDTDPLRDFGLGVVLDAAGPKVYHLIGGANASYLSATIETGHIYDEANKTEIQGIRPVCDIPGQVSVLTKADEVDDSETVSGPTTPKTNGVADFRAEGKYHRIRWANGSTAFKKAAGVVVKQAPAGDR